MHSHSKSSILRARWANSRPRTTAAWLLDRGAPVDARNVEGKTPLEVAAVAAGWSPERHDVTFYFMENARVDPARFYETARLLLDKGAELTPHAVVALGDHEAVLRLHREGRLTNATDDFGPLTI